jgi:hypothetical protein
MSTRLFVGNLPYGASEEDLRTSLASPDITIRSVRLAVDRETGRGRGFGFVEVGSPEEAERALQVWPGRLVGGRAIAIDRAHDRRPGGPGSPPGGPPRRPMGPPPPRYGGGTGYGGSGGGGAGYATPPPAAPPPAPHSDPRDHLAMDDEGEGRRRAAGRPAGQKPRKKGTTAGREAPKERGGKWRYDPSGDY